MQIHRAKAALVGLVLAVCACKTAPSTGSTTTGSTTAGGATTASTSSSGGGGTGGMDAGVCTPVHLGPVCGNCAACLEAHCCPELDTCAAKVDCFYCVYAVDVVPDGGYPDCSLISPETNAQKKAMFACMNQFCDSPCYGHNPLSDAGKGGAGAGGNCGENGGSGGTWGSGGNPP
jgi:uncharacterized membrane protein YgcG